jgi:hypothetical protein
MGRQRDAAAVEGDQEDPPRRGRGSVRDDLALSRCKSEPRHALCKSLVDEGLK